MSALLKVSLGLATVAVASAKTALLVIDVQDCFLEAACTSTGTDGSLSVPACDIIPLINDIREQKSCLFDEVIFSQDYHPAGHISFGSTHGLAPFSHLPTAFGGLGKGGLPLMCVTPTSGSTADASCCPKIVVDPSSVDCDTVLCPPNGFDYATTSPGVVTDNTACTTCAATPEDCFETEQLMWTDHCEQTGDAGFPTTLDKRTGDTVVQKGLNVHVDAYSAFMDNTATLKTQLDADLQELGITELFIAGIATDVCVQWTVKDALGGSTGAYDVTVIEDATAAVLGNADNKAAAITFMETEGATIVTAADVLAMECPPEPEPEPESTTPDKASSSKGLWPAAFSLAAVTMAALV